MHDNFADATRAYNAWLSHFLRLDRKGLARKREKMQKGGAFALLRGTFYRWSWHFAATDAAVREAPRLLAVGDLHLENYGTWRDAEGRLVWGVNDFDEATELPFTSDLVRLATSLLLASGEDSAGILPKSAAGTEAILAGYADGLRQGRPIVLEAEANTPLRQAAERLFSPVDDWREIASAGKARQPDLAILQALLMALPPGARDPVFSQTRKGIGSLGRPRWQVLADWNGGPVAREAKATAPSSATLPARSRRWFRDHRRIAMEARRAPDPCFLITESMVIRRLSPEARKIELGDVLADGHNHVNRHLHDGPLRLLSAMGAEVANIHAGTAPDPRALSAWLKRAPSDWLDQAAEATAERVHGDCKVFKGDPGVVEA